MAAPWSARRGSYASVTLFGTVDGPFCALPPPKLCRLLTEDVFLDSVNNRESFMFAARLA